MKSTFVKLATIIVVLLSAKCMVYAQGFVNLNFENATFVSDPSSPYYPYAVYASDAIPGWVPYVANSPVSLVFSNDVSLSGGDVDIIGTNWIYPQIEGDYFIKLAGVNYPGNETTAGIGQTAQIPVGALSFTFWGDWGGGISFDGQPLSTYQTGSSASYNTYSVDVSAYAGQTGELLFTTIIGGGAIIDNIQFSSSPVPEPSIDALWIVGGVLLVWCRWRK